MFKSLRKEDLQNRAAQIRAFWLPNKPIGKGNVAVADVYLADGLAFCAGATSRGKGKSPIAQPPLPRSEGGQFEPSIDSRSGWLMNTDAEYKVLSAIAETLEMLYTQEVEGTLYLYTELQPCESCSNVVTQFKKKFPKIKIELFWDYPYP